MASRSSGMASLRPCSGWEPAIGSSTTHPGRIWRRANPFSSSRRSAESWASRSFTSAWGRTSCPSGGTSRTEYVNRPPLAHSLPSFGSSRTRGAGAFRFVAAISKSPRTTVSSLLGRWQCASMNRKTAPFSVEQASESSGFLLWQVTALWQRRIAWALRSLGLTQVQYALLASLLWMSRTQRTITQAMLARHTKLDMMMTSQVLRTLETRGLLQRNPHPTDTRAKVLRLTKEGRKLAWQAVPVVEGVDREFFGALGAQLDRFNRSLLSLIGSSTQEA